MSRTHKRSSMAFHDNPDLALALARAMLSISLGQSVSFILRGLGTKSLWPGASKMVKRLRNAKSGNDRKEVSFTDPTIKACHEQVTWLSSPPMLWAQWRTIHVESTQQQALQRNFQETSQSISYLVYVRFMKEAHEEPKTRIAPIFTLEAFE